MSIGLCATPKLGWGQTTVVDREYSIKAAFLYHFSNYIEWPQDTFSSAEEPFVIGVYQTNPFASALQKIASVKQVDGRHLEVRLVAISAEIEGCQILFVPESVQPEEQKSVVQAAENADVLVVGEADQFLQYGGDVQFFLEQNKVRFAFNADIARGDTLKVSSKLLSLGKVVSSSP